MNPATHEMEGNASALVLYMAMELSNKTWKLAFSDGVKRRQVAVPAADLVKLGEAVAKAKERVGVFQLGVNGRARIVVKAPEAQQWRLANKVGNVMRDTHSGLRHRSHCRTHDMSWCVAQQPVAGVSIWRTR